MNEHPTDTAQPAPRGPTLRELQRRRYPTIKAFAAALGVSPSKAGMLLQGRYILTMEPRDICQLADVLEVSFDEVVQATYASYEEWRDGLDVKQSV